MSILLLLTLFGTAGLAAQGSPTTDAPETTVRTVLRAVRERDWPLLVRLAHPEALAELKRDLLRAVTVFSISEDTRRAQSKYLVLVFGVESVEQLMALPAETLLVRVMDARVIERSNDFVGREQRVLGRVLDGDSLAYVIIVTDSDPRYTGEVPSGALAEALPWVSEPWVDFMTLKRDREGSWRTMLDGGVHWRRGRGTSLPALEAPE